MLSLIVEAILKAIARLFFRIEALMAQFLDVLYEIFESFAGIKPVISEGKQSFLIDVFFNNDLVTTLYWGMAGIGIVMVFGFAIFAMIKKIFDSTGEKMKATTGQILTNVFKSILLIILMTAIVSATITATGTLMQQIDYLFDNVEELNNPSEIEFNNEDYATMFRILDTIGSYSLNQSYNNRYNINRCFNEIRGDLQVLERNNVFDFTYDETAEAKNSWQAAIRQIYLAADVSEDVYIDSYNESLTLAILNVINQIQTNASFKPLSYYNRGYTMNSQQSVLGRTILVASSFEAAKSKKYNQNPSLTDGIRRAFYTGDKDIYDLDDVEDYFDVGFDSWNHLVALLITALMILEFLKILINCVARIFNIILLYITAPGFIAVMPLDDGGKMKQWTVAFVIQSLSIFGTVIAVRLLMIFIPIVLSSDLVIFSSGVKNILAKLVMIVGICFTSQKASGLISGILADNAGYQSILAGDVGSGTVSKGLSLAGKVGSGVLSAGASIGGKALSGLSTASGLTTLGNKIGEGMKNMGQSMRDKGGFIGAAKSGWTTDAQDKEKAQEAEKKADRDDTRDFRNAVMGSLNNMGSASSSTGSYSSSSTQTSQIQPPPKYNPIPSQSMNPVLEEEEEDFK